MPSLTTADASELFRHDPDRYVDVGAGEVAVRTVGRGPDVLFVHGWPVSGATFRTLLPHLVDHVTCHVIDLPGSGHSRFDSATPISLGHHIRTVRLLVKLLDLDDVAVVGHDSGGLIARHALAGDRRVRAMGLLDTEQPQGLTWRFRLLLAGGRLPGFGLAFGWAVGRPRVRAHPLVLGGAFADARTLDGEFDEFFLRPLRNSVRHRDASARLIRTFDRDLIPALATVHRRIEAPVHLVWGEQDAFLPVSWARDMVDTFPRARLTVISGAGLFCHEERPAEVAAALLPTLSGER